jgi:hypothetical protein
VRQRLVIEGMKAANTSRIAAPGGERRSARRVQMEVTARVRPYYETPELSEELLKAKNVSRNGFYFVSRRAGFRKDMNLYVACPAGHSQTQADAECARVVRVDSLGEGLWGVAVALLRSCFGYHRHSIQKQGSVE